MGQTALRVQGLVARLNDLGLATTEQIAQAKQEQKTSEAPISEILVRLGIVRNAEVGKRLTTQLGWLPQRLEAIPLRRPSPSPGFFSRHRIIPLEEEAGRLVVATDDPFTVLALEFLEARVGSPLDVVLVQEQDFARLTEQLTADSHVQTPPKPAAPKEPVKEAVPIRPVEPKPLEPPPRKPQRPEPTPLEAAVSEEDEPIIQLVDSMLKEAVRLRASDIHVEPYNKRVRVRYRIDGVLHDVNTAPKALQGPITSRLKIMAGLNIAEKRLPQDGRLQLTVEQRPLDVRISTLPALHGESIVMRLLDRGKSILGLEQLGFSADGQRTWEQLIRRPHGMLLVTGPTGSGKTTTLYAALSTLNRPDRKLITVEDPVEYQLPGVNQVQVKPAIGLTFAAGLRSMLRQAPDVIMVGEIRDQETAQIAIQAALTGHLVLSTLHTNDASSAVTRLIDMGIPSFLVASTVQGVMAQRLVRRICQTCRIAADPTPEERTFLGEQVTSIMRGVGCETCRRTGYHGRLAIFELLVITDAIRQLIVTNSSAGTIREQALREGMQDLREDGRAKIVAGLTTMEEVLRATPQTMD